jgi:hypothetical protein
MTSDAVFGVKDSLITPMIEATEAHAKEYSVAVGSGVLEHAFVLVSEEETQQLRDRNALEAMEKLFPGRKVRLLDHLPVPDVD